MQNPDIARLFDEVADLLEIQDANPFRVRAYRNAARTIRDFPEPIAERARSGVKDLTDIPGIGDDLAEKIAAIVTTGELPLRKQLAAKLPAGLLDLLRIPGLGPKRVKLLYKKLKARPARRSNCAAGCRSICAPSSPPPTARRYSTSRDPRPTMSSCDRSRRVRNSNSTSTACSAARGASRARPKRRSTRPWASIGSRRSCARRAARPPWRASIASPSSPSPPTCPATSRCTPARP